MAKVVSVGKCYFSAKRLNIGFFTDHCLNGFFSTLNFWTLQGLHFGLCRARNLQISAEVAQHVSLPVSSGDAAISTEHRGSGLDRHRHRHIPTIYQPSYWYAQLVWPAQNSSCYHPKKAVNKRKIIIVDTVPKKQK